MNNDFTLNQKFIDTHCHLEMDEFNPDREIVIQRAIEAGIEAIITIGSDMKGNKGALEISQKYDFIYCSVGIHPHDAKDFNEEIYNQIKDMAIRHKIHNLSPENRKNKVVAIGEIGLDYHYDNSPRDIQRKVFLKQLLLAKEINLPVVIHSREAKSDTLSIMKESGVTNGVLHCFSGDIDMAEKAMAMGFHISIAGPVTFKNAKKLHEVARIIPDDFLLIETDAPYLTPEPYRGRRNEPAFILQTAKKIAELRDLHIEDVARITTLNAKRLFNIGEISSKAEIAYKIRGSLYLNITNRCTNRCSFCIRFISDYVKGHNLRLAYEPSEEELKAAIGNPRNYKEIVFCGYGEPTIRLDLIKSLSSWIKQHRGMVRINTNGHGNIIHKRNILPELKGLVDSLSISLNAHNEETYNRICKPAYKNAYNEVLNFIKEAKKIIPDVSVTVVTAEGVDIEKCRKIADNLGVGFRLRKLDVVG